MVILDDSQLPAQADGLEIVRRLGRREITHALHDVDGTHSLIRDWPAAMSASLQYAMTSGLPDDFDGDENLRRLIARVGGEPLVETDRFCVESAGMSALTQMEWAIRRGIEEGAIDTSPWITHRLALEDVTRVFADLPKRPGLVKAIVEVRDSDL